jgi:D-inositol-3-phosphate glycosyltransferase
MIPAGVDMDLFRVRPREEARARFRFQDGQKIVAFVGRLEPEKNPILVVEEVLALAQRHPDAHLVMVGGGRMATTVRKLAQSARDRLTLLDPMPQEELAWFLSAADALVVASCHEGLPTIAIEALACGTPIVGTRVGILPEIIKTGMNGFLMESLSQLRFFMEKALYEVDWVRDACRTSVRQVGWDRVAPAIMEVYREISA